MNTTRLVYRLENASNQRGVYTGGGYGVINEWLYEKTGSKNCAKHPTPSEDSLLTKNCNEANIAPFGGFWRFGFKSMAQLRAWFFDDTILDMLANEGIVFTVYEVTDEKEFIDGNAQIVFHGDCHIEANRKLSVSPKRLNDDLKSDDDVKAAIELGLTN